MLRKFDCFFLINRINKQNERKNASEQKPSLRKKMRLKSATFLHYRLLQKRTCLKLKKKQQEKRKIVSTKHQPKTTTETKILKWVNKVNKNSKRRIQKQKPCND